MKKISILKNKQQGDTIIEVMMALSILGIAIAVAFNVANRSYSVGISAQERVEAVKVAQTQIELIKEAANTPANTVFTLPEINPAIDTDSQLFCVNITDTSPVLFDAGETIQETIGPIDPITYPTECSLGSSDRYNVSVVRRNNVFTVRVRWENITGSNIDEVVQLHRVYDNPDTFTFVNPTPPVVDLCSNLPGVQVALPVGYSEDGSGGCVLDPSIVSFVVEKIAPRSGNRTPFCSSSATLDRSGTTVTLNGVNATTNSASTATFNDLDANTSYNATITGVPSGHELCPPVTRTVSTGAPGSTVTNTDFKIRPLCTLTQTGTNPGYWRLGARRTDADGTYIFMPSGVNYRYIVPWIPPPGARYIFIQNGPSFRWWDGSTVANYRGYDAVYVPPTPIFSRACPS